MRHAYYIAAHHKPYQFRWILSAAPKGTSLVLLHVDAKTPDEVAAQIDRAAADRGGVVAMPRRFNTWCGWSQVANELRAMRIALAEPGWSYFVNLSGQCYPTKPQAEIDDILAAAWPNSFIRCWSFDQVRAAEPDDPHLQKWAYLDWGGRLRRLPFRLPPTTLDVDYKGSTWHALTRQFCEWVVTSPLARRIGWRLRHAFCPDELFFQAAIMNSPFRGRRMPDAGRYFVFPGPKILGSADLEPMLASDALFARKFDAAVDREVLEGLATRLGYPVPEAA